MHEGKMRPLLDFLATNELAWPARDVITDRNQEWYALHPTLGEAVMSIIAIAIATEKGLDIVTSSGRVHRALARLDEDAVIRTLLGGAPPLERPGGPEPAEIADDLAQVVMVTAFHLGRLTAEQIAELQRDGKDLRQFKNELVTIAETMPDIRDPGEREKRLRSLASEVIGRWKRYKKALPRFAADALVSASAWKPPELVTSVLAGATSATMLAAGAGLLIGAGVYAGLATWRAYKERAESPYRFLSRIEKAGAVLAARPVAPA